MEILVPPQAGVAQHLVGQDVLVGLVVVVGVAARLGGQGGTRFDSQGVHAHMGRRRVQGEHALQRGTPVGQGLTGGPEDQVDAVGGGEALFAGQPGGADHRRRVMLAAERGENVGDHGLGTERQPRHPAGAQGGQFGGRDCLGVALHGHFGTGGHADALPHRVQDGYEGVGRQQ